jgi:hypothetical protein
MAEKEINRERLIDEAMMTVEEMVSTFIEPMEEITDEEAGVSLFIDKIAMDMPVQLQVMVAGDGTVQIGSTPPLYKLETSFTPVYHQVRFSFEKTD